MDIGFVGIGSMGAAMVPHLVAAGHRVSVWNRTRASAEAIDGVTVLDTVAKVFDNDVVLTMLSDDVAVRAQVLDSGALAAARPGLVHAMMATISPALAAELAQRHHQHALGYVSAPVFGVPAAAAARQLNIVVAGAPDAQARLQPVFELLGKRVWPLGDDPRRANIAKIAGNMMIALAIEAMGEAAALTESYGLDAADFLDIVTNTLFASPSYQRYGGFIAQDRYEPGFKLTLGLKDVNLALDAGRASGAGLPSAELVAGHMRQGIEQGLGAQDWSVFTTLLRKRNGE